MSLKAFLNTLTVLLVFTQVPKSGATPGIDRDKSFAVFTASYNRQGDLVRGGVCGTVFFVEGHKAITAFHVLKPQSFRPKEGFEKVRVWLVHEDYRAVEVKAEYLESNADKDITVITLPVAAAVDARFVFKMDHMIGDQEKVFTDGFVANTDGPVLVREGEDVNIASVPHLTRLHLEGTVVRNALVNLKAKDIDLKSSPNVELSYKPVVGISGGPVVAHGHVIAMNSFADPKTFRSTWALRLLP